MPVATKKPATRKKPTAKKKNTKTPVIAIKQADIKLLEDRVTYLESKVTQLVNTLYSEFKKEMRHGPAAVAKSLSNLIEEQ